MKKRKLVFQWSNGNFYVWRGESTACIVKHETSNFNDARDFSSYLNPEPPSDDGKFVWYDWTMSYQVSPDQSFRGITLDILNSLCYPTLKQWRKL